MCDMIKGLEVAILPLTYRCNAKCAMCGIGDLNEFDELSLQEYENIFGDPIWSKNVKSVNITGGEPFLRNDIFDITESLLRSSSKLESLIINTNGIITNSIVDYIKRVMLYCKPYSDVQFKIYISLDGIGEQHDKIRNVNGCFEKTNNTINELLVLRKEYNLGIVLNCTVTKLNYLSIYDVLNYANEKKLEINYTYAMTSDIYFQNNEKLFEMDKNEREYFIDFLRTIISTPAGLKMSSYYRALINMLQGKERQIGCIFQQKGVFIHPNGKLYRCWVHNEELGSVKSNTLSEIWIQQNEKCIGNSIIDTCKSCYNNCYQEYQRLEAIKKCLSQMN